MVTALTTRFTELAGCRVPIQQGPMGPVSTPALAVAVADAGGVGSITAQWMPAAELDTILADMAEQTAGVLAANFLTADIDREAVAAAAARVRIVDYFWADPDPALVELAHRSGALACWQVGSLDEARAAAGVRAGTRFVATNESGAHPAYKQAIADAIGGSTEITGAFSVCPLCATVPRARVLRSSIDALRELADDAVGETTVAGELISLPKGHGLPPGAAATGHIDAMPMYAGQSAAAVLAVEPVARVIESWCAAADDAR